MPGDIRSYVAGNFFLNLDGQNCGSVKSVAGGGAIADVVNEEMGADHVVRKHLGQVKYEELVIDFGFAMKAPLYDWIAKSWEMNYQRKNGSIVGCDYKLEAKTEREFVGALITETTFPVLDASSKQAANISLKVAPELTRAKKPSGKGEAPAAKSPQKVAMQSNFRLEIAGLEASKVNKIDAFSVKQSVTEDAAGERREPQKEPGKLEFPNLKITLSQSHAQSWFDWFEDFVVKGNCSEDKEKTGTIFFLAPNFKDTVASIELQNLGIFKLSEDPVEAHSEQIKRVTAELYCERMKFHPPGGK
jgi:phage tail-like protein